MEYLELLHYIRKTIGISMKSVFLQLFSISIPMFLTSSAKQFDPY